MENLHLALIECKMYSLIVFSEGMFGHLDFSDCCIGGFLWFEVKKIFVRVTDKEVHNLDNCMKICLESKK